ncbi:Aste57867_22960 [Aphanomyces stellatus]|uniref:Peptidyl-prolyl cis-trans isomerase n=1 Tax=Aphanomyces stellatus TaxID=120398 RepID=A0A485LM54_9STRA|nr:hypothetical protein As57867_022889 [Aphanomyces stellatus]VFT99610.1 Aste57867_22960 [Aphanomyces stellatus]
MASPFAAWTLETAASFQTRVGRTPPMKQAARSSRRENPIVFLDLSIGDDSLGRLVIELRADVVPRTAENFRMLCTGDAKTAKGEPKRYLGCLVHRIVRDSHLQAGDIGGEGGSSAFSTRYFEDENFILRHVGIGIVSMVNAGPDTNGSQFCISFASAPWLDNKHVVFGALLGEPSYEALAKLHRMAASETGMPLLPVRITGCGQLYPS